MSVQSKWVFVLIGNDKTGKTTLQKKLIKLLSDDNRDVKLDCNLRFKITHPYLIRKIQNFSVGNRSIQEKLETYLSIPEYFDKHFCPEDLCFISSHLNPKDVGEIILESQQRFYNTCGIFFSNSIKLDPDLNAAISKMPWDERWIAKNDSTNDVDVQDKQLQHIAETIVQMLIERTKSW